MTINTHRVGAVASAALLFTVLVNAGASLANSDNRANSDNQTEGSLAGSGLAAAQDNAADDALPRFVANPVIQAVPEAVIEETAPTIASDAASLADLVGTLGVESNFSGEMTCLAQAVYFESRGEPLAGQLAVAKVVINRRHASSFPSSYCSVVTQRAQFSFVKNGRIPAPKTSSTAWKRAKAIAQIADRDLWESAADDSLYFHAKSVHPSWARRKTARATIDRHIFYR